MKTQITAAFLALIIPMISFADGPSVSGGGGGGRIEVSNRFGTPGTLSLTISSKTGGALEVVKKYFVLGGAAVEGAPGKHLFYSLKGVSGGLHEATAQEEKDFGHKHQLQLELTVAEFDGMNSWATGTQASFAGAMAMSLYVGMEKSGLQDVGQTLDENNQVLGKIYRDGSLYCEKRQVAICSVSIDY